jgi:hypothetical protein
MYVTAAAEEQPDKLCWKFPIGLTGFTTNCTTLPLFCLLKNTIAESVVQEGIQDLLCKNF